MDLNVEEVEFLMKIIDLDAKMFSEKAMVAYVFEIDDSGIYTIIFSIN